LEMLAVVRLKRFAAKDAAAARANAQIFFNAAHFTLLFIGACNFYFRRVCAIFFFDGFVGHTSFVSDRRINPRAGDDRELEPSPYAIAHRPSFAPPFPRTKQSGSRAGYVIREAYNDRGIAGNR
jgi:hypothetical protein